MPLVVISVLFGLSLCAAWVLFKFLQSTATVKKPEYQIGGAAAGFVVIFTLLSLTYMQIDSRKNQDNITRLTTRLDEARAEADKGKTCLAEQATEITYEGTVSPSVPNAYVVLGVTAVQLQQDGRFAIKVHHVKPADLPNIYVIGADSRPPYRQVFADDDPKKITIPH
jgi:hypothetical protein